MTDQTTTGTQPQVTRWERYLILGLSGACLLAAYVLMTLGDSTLEMQAEIQKQQVVMNRNAGNQQFTQALLRDLIELAISDDNIKGLLAKHGHLTALRAPASESPKNQ